jgi:hypothetical protein
MDVPAHNAEDGPVVNRIRHLALAGLAAELPVTQPGTKEAPPFVFSGYR